MFCSRLVFFLSFPVDPHMQNLSHTVSRSNAVQCMIAGRLTVPGAGRSKFYPQSIFRPERCIVPPFILIQTSVRTLQRCNHNPPDCFYCCQACHLQQNQIINALNRQPWASKGYKITIWQSLLIETNLFLTQLNVIGLYALTAHWWFLKQIPLITLFLRVFSPCGLGCPLRWCHPLDW